jgi:hypothetical protein
MGRAYNEEAGYAEAVPFDAESFAVTLGILGHAELLLVVENEGQVIGMAAASVAPSIFNQGVLIGRGPLWYVLPEHRKGTVKNLLSALECAAKNQGAAFFDAVAESGARSTPLARIYSGRGYNLTETTFRKRL